MTPETAKSDSYGELLCLSLDDILPSRDDQRKLLENYCVLFPCVLRAHSILQEVCRLCTITYQPYLLETKSEVVSRINGPVYMKYDRSTPILYQISYISDTL